MQINLDYHSLELPSRNRSNVRIHIAARKNKFVEDTAQHANAHPQVHNATDHYSEHLVEHYHLDLAKSY